MAARLTYFITTASIFYMLDNIIITLNSVMNEITIEINAMKNAAYGFVKFS